MIRSTAVNDLRLLKTSKTIVIFIHIAVSRTSRTFLVYFIFISRLDTYEATSRNRARNRNRDSNRIASPSIELKVGFIVRIGSPRAIPHIVHTAYRFA